MAIPSNPYDGKPYDEYGFNLMGQIKLKNDDPTRFDCVDVNTLSIINDSIPATTGILLITTNMPDFPEICCTSVSSLAVIGPKRGFSVRWNQIQTGSGKGTYKRTYKFLISYLNSIEAYLYIKEIDTDKEVGRQFDEIKGKITSFQLHHTLGYSTRGVILPNENGSPDEIDDSDDEDEDGTGTEPTPEDNTPSGEEGEFAEPAQESASETVTDAVDGESVFVPEFPVEAYPDDEPYNGPLNLIYFGAPGTGKSYMLNNDMKALLNGDNLSKSQYRERYERVTFHPAYTYANFVGTYKPETDENGKITYEYVPGPFMELYVRALKDPKHRYLLVIEEINRAEMAAVFGEVFQLLDREDEGGDKGKSKYTVHASRDVKKYLANEFGISTKDKAKMNSDPRCSELCIPSNMYIWATMNSADQGVKPMDTAFKRRWDFKYIGINDSMGTKDKPGMNQYTVELTLKDKSRQKINWNELRMAINDWLADHGINEDKLLGPFYLSDQVLKSGTKEQQEKHEMDPDVFKDAFKNKIIMYLYEDAAKARRNDLFENCKKNKDSKSVRFSEICDKFDELGAGIFPFTDDVKKNIIEEPSREDDPTPAPEGEKAVPTAEQTEPAETGEEKMPEGGKEE